MIDRFADHQLAEIRGRTSLVALISKVVKLRKASKASPELVGLCPFHKERTPSFSVNEDKGLYYCRGCGATGDVFAFVMRSEGVTFRDAAQRLAADAAVNCHRPDRVSLPASPIRQPDTAKHDLERERHAAFVRQLWQNIWSTAMPARRSPIAVWLRTRRIAFDPDELDTIPLRWTSTCPMGKTTLPAMLALMTDAVTGEPTGIHRTFLLPDGSAKAPVHQPRMMLGKAGVIRLSPDEEVAQGLGICEGIETGLAIMATGWRPLWAAGTLGAVRTFPVLAGVACLTIFADPKPHEVEGARQCARRWQETCRETVVRIPGIGDWNDALVTP